MAVKENIVPAKPTNVAFGGSTGQYYNNGGGGVIIIPGTDCTIVTTGKPVLVMILPDTSLNFSTYGGVWSSSPSIFRNGTQIVYGISGSNAPYPTYYQQSNSPSSCNCIDEVGAGTYTYQIGIRGQGSPSYPEYIWYCRLFAMELI